ncbi:MAG: hypothetical protein EPO06_11745 [Burkholderiaceae bacterium]|nr:MAG: hypothetical protein EPO06_11745 [Burkholderiaceae bacterium]
MVDQIQVECEHDDTHAVPCLSRDGARALVMPDPAPLAEGDEPVDVEAVTPPAPVCGGCGLAPVARLVELGVTVGPADPDGQADLVRAESFARVPVGSVTPDAPPHSGLTIG